MPTTAFSSARDWRGLLGRSGFEVVGKAGTPSELIELVREVRPDRPEG